MQKLKNKVHKAEKKRARRKDYGKKRNIRKNNWPTPKFKVEEPVMKAGKEVGKKTVIKKTTKNLLILPKSKKHKENRKQKKQSKKLLISSLADQSANK